MGNNIIKFASQEEWKIFECERIRYYSKDMFPYSVSIFDKIQSINKFYSVLINDVCMKSCREAKKYYDNLYGNYGGGYWESNEFNAFEFPYKSTWLSWKFGSQYDKNIPCILLDAEELFVGDLRMQ